MSEIVYGVDLVPLELTHREHQQIQISGRLGDFLHDEGVFDGQMLIGIALRAQPVAVAGDELARYVAVPNLDNDFPEPIVIAEFLKDASNPATNSFVTRFTYLSEADQ